MEPLKYTDAIKLIEDHIVQSSFPPNRWYVGVTDDLERRMGEHQVDEQADLWIGVRLVSATEARAVEKALLGILGCSGGGGGGDEPDYVYAYKISKSTREDA